MRRRAFALLAALAVSSYAGGAAAQTSGQRLAQTPVNPAPAASADADELVAKGRALAADNCARCHNIGDSGASPHDKAPPFREVVTRYPSEHLAEALAEGIASGHPDMPVFVMTAEQIDQFLAFLDSLSPPEPAPNVPAPR